MADAPAGQLSLVGGGNVCSRAVPTVTVSFLPEPCALQRKPYTAARRCTAARSVLPTRPGSACGTEQKSLKTYNRSSVLNATCNQLGPRAQRTQGFAGIRWCCCCACARHEVSIGDDKVVQLAVDGRQVEAAPLGPCRPERHLPSLQRKRGKRLRSRAGGFGAGLIAAYGSPG